MRIPKWLFVVGLVVPGLVMATQRASMEAPVVRGTPDEVQVSARFSSFTAGSEYRLGVGSSRSLEGVTITLEKEGTAVASSITSFDQRQSWWSDAGELKARGFFLQDSQLPANGETLYMRVTLPRETAEAAGAIFVFVAKRYGPNTWYLEDGSEINKSHW